MKLLLATISILAVVLIGAFLAAIIVQAAFAGDTATPAVTALPSIGQAQAALTGLQTAWNDLSAAWAALQPDSG